MTSMKGATYEVQGEKSLKRIKLTNNLPACEVLILNQDFAEQEEKQYRRIFISNCLDKRYYYDDTPTE